MSAPLTIDASVFVSALSSMEPRHQESRDFLQTLRDRPRPVILPTLVKPEVAGGGGGRLTARPNAAHS
jgi:predicted nucleic acid-binding protein